VTDGGATTFRKPVDNIGEKTFSDYGAYANNHIYTIGIPGCDVDGKVFVGKRKEADYPIYARFIPITCKKQNRLHPHSELAIQNLPLLQINLSTYLI